MHDSRVAKKRIHEITQLVPWLRPCRSRIRRGRANRDGEVGALDADVDSESGAGGVEAGEVPNQRQRDHLRRWAEVTDGKANQRGKETEKRFGR